jgi:GNAT superfamily N-acetyltransferase
MVTTTASSTDVIGYYSIATGGVTHDEGPPSSLKRNMPNPIPVVILGRLAVDKGFQGSGIGSALLQDALRRSLSLHTQVGFAAVIVHAIDDEAKAFYIKYGMREFPRANKTLYIPVETIIKTVIIE